MYRKSNDINFKENEHLECGGIHGDISTSFSL